MIKSELHTGPNRTGTDTSPIDKKLLIDAARKTVPSMAGDETAIEGVRAEYLVEEATIGSLPPPMSLTGVAGVLVGIAKGADFPVLVDKLGERLAFERTGFRLYTALIDKLDASEPLPGGPTREELEAIRSDELGHFHLVREVMLSLGVDPTAVTPSADIAAVTSMGLLQVVGDPRTNLKQSLEAMLVAELVDNDGWTLLVELANGLGRSELSERFEGARAVEIDHLIAIRGWVVGSTLTEAGASPPTEPL